MNQNSQTYWYAGVALPVALLFAFFTPPLQAPDEVGHYWRSVAIARGQLVADRVDGRPGGMLPVDARDLVATLWIEPPGRPLRFDTERLQRARTLRPSSKTVRLSYPAFYTAVPYAPQAAAIALTRAIRAPTLVSFYAGRMANAIAGVLLVVLAMRIAPAAAPAFAAVALTPMFLYLAGSFSADVVTAGAAFCTAAAGIRLWQKAGSARSVAAFGASAVVLSLSKPAYLLIALVSAPALLLRKRRIGVAIALCLVAVGVLVAASTISASYYAMRTDVLTDARQQMAHVIAAPVDFIAMALLEYVTHAPRYFDHLVGRLGWLDVGLPLFVPALYALLFVYVAATLPAVPTTPQRLLLLVIFAATLLIVALSQYLIWTAVGATTIDGIQGRYLLPPFPLLLIALGGGRWRYRVAVPAAVAAVGNATALHALVRHYYTF